MYDAGNPDAGGFAPGDDIIIMAWYTWHGSPHKDYTVKVYSKMDLPVTETDEDTFTEDLGTNQLYTDGVSEPSELTGNAWTLDDMHPSWYLPDCEKCMACEYCADGDCDDVTEAPDSFGGGGALLTPPTVDD